jgi:hypothetical protein
MGMSGSLQIGRAIPIADVQANGTQYPLSALIAGAAIRGPRSAMADGGQAMSESSSVRLDSAAGAGAASNGRMSGGPQARPTVGLIHWQSFAKNFMFFVRRRRSAVGRVSDSYVYILDAMGALY